MTTKRHLLQVIRDLSKSEVEDIYNYIVRYKKISELQKVKEEQAIEIAGYCTASTIEASEWEAMLKRAEQSK